MSKVVAPGGFSHGCGLEGDTAQGDGKFQLPPPCGGGSILQAASFGVYISCLGCLAATSALSVHGPRFLRLLVCLMSRVTNRLPTRSYDQTSDGKIDNWFTPSV